MVLLLVPVALAAGAEPKPFEGPRSCVEVEGGLELDRALVRDIQRVVRLALGRMVRRYDLTTKEVLRLPGGAPAWFRPDAAPGDRIRIAICEGDVTAGAKNLSPAQTHEIARRVALDVLRRTVGQGIPLWMESGIADRLADAALDGKSPVAAAFRKSLAADGFDLEWMALLGETNVASFARNRGRALGYALVALLEEAGSGLVPTCYRRSRELLRHLSRVPARLYPNDRVLREEYTALARALLTPPRTAPWDPGRALAAWVEAGYPTGAAFRSSKAAVLLERLEASPPTLRVSLRGAFEMPYDENGVKYRIVQDPKVEWSLPWPSRMVLYAGVRGLRGTAAARGDPAARNKGSMGTHEKLRWKAESAGERLFPMGINIRYRPGTDRFGFLLLRVTSPAGVDYAFLHEWELK